MQVRSGSKSLSIKVGSKGKIVWEFPAIDHPELNPINAGNLQKPEDSSILVTNSLRRNEGRWTHDFIFSKT